ncbi:glycosyltransferase [uncultured Helicobacter sp.]|uniref:glycosyltransferase n=1 Tax=uncultured Helicobacter sp. TaxID=175537 RepID=UPI002635535B|nr:glycosyltransferase [uncultured Helicobacter sp.]
MSSHIHFYIIIPLYNAERYIKRCLKSIKSQTYRDFTAIMINDGSTDKSIEIVTACIKDDKRFILLSQDNQGQSMARNKALEIVRDMPPPHYTKSHYIYFVDADDYLESNALEHITKILEQYKVDVLVENSITARDAQSNEIVPFDYSVFPQHIKGLYTPHTLIQSLGEERHIATTWAFVVNVDFLIASRISFIPSIVYEDLAFCTQIILAAQSIYVDNAHVYNYVLSPDSIMRATPSPNARMRQANSYFTLLQMFVAYKEQSDDEIFKSHYHNTCIIIVKKLMRSLQFIGYKAGFSKADLKPYLPYIRGKYRFCYHFPRIYGILKRIRLVL